jgi:hypothetical protein
MTLQDYIATVGDKTAAKVLGITERAARSYRLGTRLPRPERAQQMVRRSQGRLTMQAIYGR